MNSEWTVFQAGFRSGEHNMKLIMQKRMSALRGALEDGREFIPDIDGIISMCEDYILDGEWIDTGEPIDDMPEFVTNE